MGFLNHSTHAAPTGKVISDLALTKTAAMTLEVAAGSITRQAPGVTSTLSAAQSYAFTADSSLPVQVFMGIITNEVSTDLWVDEYVDNGATVRADPPVGWTLIADIAWFTIPAAETDLDNTTIHRRVWL